MALTNSQRNKLAAGLGAIAASVVAGVLLLGEQGPSHRDTVLTTMEDAGVLHTGQGGTTTDLLSEEIAGGAESTTEVNITGQIANPEVVGPPQFDVLSTTVTWEPPTSKVVIRVQNKTGSPMRFAGFLHYDLLPVDAGI